MAKKIQITETVLRDAHQSLIATRMPLSDMIPILPALDDIGFYSLECWGGATFDSCIRFLNEDPWERLRTIRKYCPKTRLQMLFRGQNMLGYRHYADDVLEYFVQRSVANGIDVIRIFDALNDIKNLQTAINATKAAKKENPNVEAQVAMSYTTGPIFTTDYYIDYAKRIEAAGADSICIKDMAALLTPYYTAELVAAVKKAVSIPGIIDGGSQEDGVIHARRVFRVAHLEHSPVAAGRILPSRKRGRADIGTFKNRLIGSAVVCRRQLEGRI